MNVFAQHNPFLLKALVFTQLTASITIAGTLVAQADIVNPDTVTNINSATDKVFPNQIEITPTSSASANSLVNKLRGNTQATSPVQAVATTTQIPVPGTAATSSATLKSTATPQAPDASIPTDAVAQILVDPGQSTRGGSSYVGIAGNIGLSDSGSTALGDGNFMIISKIGLTSTFSARPSIVLGDNAVILVPVTYDFSFQPVEAFADPLPLAPYVGGGVAISTGDDSTFGAVVTGGVDLPITSQLTATAAINVAFVDSTDVGILIGVGYNFGGFGL